MTELPPEVVTNILTRLPVKSLLRFRCVSKVWSTLIDSRYFIKLHLRQSAETKTNRNLMITHRRIDFVSLDSLDVTVNHEPPFKCEASTAQFLGSCDGLILVHLGSLKLGLWNPFTRCYQQIPSECSDITAPRDKTRGGHSITMGLGYDPVIDDYKVVRMIICYDKSMDTFVSEVKVYSLKSNSWKKVQDLPHYLCLIGSFGVYLSGALHWDSLGNYSKGDFQSCIAAFDLATEEHRSVPLPDFSKEKNFLLNVDVLEGCLCLLCLYPKCHLDVWVMKDYGVVESWTKLFSVEQPKHIREFGFVYPMAYSKNNEEILLGQDDKKLLWFNLKSNVVHEINIRGMPSSFNVRVCVESLVWFGTGNELRGQGTRNRIEKKRDGFLSTGFKLKL